MNKQTNFEELLAQLVKISRISSENINLYFEEMDLYLSIEIKNLGNEFEFTQAMLLIFNHLNWAKCSYTNSSIIGENPIEAVNILVNKTEFQNLEKYSQEILSKY